MDIFFQVLVNGLMLGGLFAIIGIGLTLIFGIVKVINFAHGEFLMVGMYAVFLITTALGVHPYMTAIAVIPLLFVLGMLTQHFLIRPLMKARDEHIQIFVTVGLSSGLRTPLEIGPIRVLVGQLVVFAAAAVLVVGLTLYLNNTQFGRAIRAVAQNRTAAQLMGINVNRVYVVTFGLGAACVGLAASLIAPLYPTSQTVGTYFVLIAFVVVVLGGMGSITGAFLGAMVIGLIDSFSAYYIGSDLREVAVFTLFLLILILRPQGLFAGHKTLSHVS